MIDIKFIRQNLTQVKDGLAAKKVKVDLELLLAVDQQYKELLLRIEKIKAQKNNISKEISSLSGKDREAKIATIKAGDQAGMALKAKLKASENKLNQLLLTIPNLPASDVKIGQSENDNEILKLVGEPTSFNFQPKDYLALGRKLDLIDTERAAKVSGTRFGYLKNQAVLLAFALVQYALEVLTKEGFRPLLPPVIIKEEAMRGMGYLERGGEEVYKTTKGDFYLVGTSEQSGIPLHMKEILLEQELPKRYVAFSSCFRSEAGSYGKDTRGILRVHQFEKVEMLSFTKPENSDQEHEYLLSLEEKLMQGLKLPYRVIKMCTADLGDPAARKYDIETWLPSQQKYRETHSTSSCTDFQARRLQIRYKDLKVKSNKYVHTLNGTAFALGRMIVMILENYQTVNGTIKVPTRLQKYLNFTEII